MINTREIDQGDAKLAEHIADLAAQGLFVTYDAVTGDGVTVLGLDALPSELICIFTERLARLLVEEHRLTERLHRWQARN